MKTGYGRGMIGTDEPHWPHKPDWEAMAVLFAIVLATVALVSLV